MSEAFVGPDVFANVLIEARNQNLAREDGWFRGDISNEGLRKLVEIAYYASLSPNEGRFPRLPLFVLNKKENVAPLVAFDEELNFKMLNRVGPTLASKDHGILVRENGERLQMSGLVSLRGYMTEEDLRGQPMVPIGRPFGLFIEIRGPGDLRAGEHTIYRYYTGKVLEQIPVTYKEWYKSWYQRAAAQIFVKADLFSPGEQLVAVVWSRILESAGRLRHGGCFVIVEKPDDAPIKAGILAASDLRPTLIPAHEMAMQEPTVGGKSIRTDHARLRVLLGERLETSIDAIANLSATDGCVVFDRELGLYSFGSMIDVSKGEVKPKTVLKGDTDEELEQSELKTFGARRLSAIQLCCACPGAIAFVISQDGDLRIFVSKKEGGKVVVRLYDRAWYW